MPNSELEIIQSKFHQVELKKGDFLVKAGQVCQYMAFVLDGYFRIYNLAKDEEITLWIAGPSSFVTDLSSFVYDEAAHWNIQCLSDTKMLRISRSDHHTLLNESEKWMAFDNKLLSNAFKMLENRMFAHLHLSASERYEMLLESDPEFINHVPLVHIASMLGMKPETLSRMRKSIS
jgi:CRP-like cAMP-binding protein